MTLTYFSAQALAGMLREEDLKSGLIYPPLSRIREVSVGLAVALAPFLYEAKLATLEVIQNFS